VLTRLLYRLRYNILTGAPFTFDKRTLAYLLGGKVRITGYATLVGFFEHAVGENNEDLKALIGASATFPGPGFLLLTRNSDLLRWCFGNGLRVVQPMTLMSTDLYNEPAGAFLPSIVYQSVCFSSP